MRGLWVTDLRAGPEKACGVDLWAAKPVHYSSLAIPACCRGARRSPEMKGLERTAARKFPPELFRKASAPASRGSAGGFMYAVIRTGGKQYRVAPGDVVKIESVGSNDGEAQTIEFSDVLAVSGEPG